MLSHLLFFDLHISPSPPSHTHKSSHIEKALRTQISPGLMSQSIPTGYISPLGQPPGKFFERANPGHPGNFFCLIPLPRGKNDGQIPGGGANFSQTRRNCSLSVQKILKKTMRQYNFFYLESLTKPLYFKLKQNHSEVLLQP